MLTKIMWNIVIEKDRNKQEEKTRTFYIAAFISNLLIAVEVGVFCLFLDKKVAVLNMIATLFDENKKYSEVEVNEILKPVYDDFVLLRRYLIDYKFLTREKDGSCYSVNKILY